MASTAPAPERLARADLCRFLAACYYEPGPEFAEERLFDSMAAAAARIDPDLAGCARRLGEAFCGETLDNLLVDYTRLFLGPPLLAHPYASVWLPGADAVDLYAEGGFRVDESFHELPDHIAAELEFLYQLTYRNGADALRRRFLAEHLGRWVPPFAEAVQAQAATAFYRQLAWLTQRIVAIEALA